MVFFNIPMKNSTIKGLGLISGGLDSLLAVKIIQEQGIEVIGLSFTSPFFDAKGSLASTEALGIPLKVIDISHKYLPILLNPRYGFGKNLNPCIDCHGLMARQAGKYMKEVGASFVFTGEVLGQRPMSQRRDALRCVDKLSGIDGYILRPLSAKLLPQTIMEQEGIVNRDLLLDIQGRSRRRQLQLAQKWNITVYTAPGGGCLLTKEGFSRKLKELMQRDKEIDVRDIELLKWGRHFRLPEGSKLVTGRNRKDNQNLSSMKKPDDIVIKVRGYPGPMGLIPGHYKPLAEKDIDLACYIVASYSNSPTHKVVIVNIEDKKTSYNRTAIKKEVAIFQPFLV